MTCCPQTLRQLFARELQPHATAAIGALAAGPSLHGMDPTAHAYPATVWVIVLWTGVHLAAGIVMQLYCLARSLAGRLTPAHDADIRNVALYWHFVALTAVVAVAVTALMPLVA